MGWNVEIASVESVRDFSYERILAKYKNYIKQQGYKGAYCEITKNYDYAIEAVKKASHNYEEFLFQCDESYRILVGTYLVISNEKGWLKGDKIFWRREEEVKNKEDFKKPIATAVATYSMDFTMGNDCLHVFIAGKDGRVSAVEEFVDNISRLISEFSKVYKKRYGSVDEEEVYERIFMVTAKWVDPDPLLGLNGADRVLGGILKAINNKALEESKMYPFKKMDGKVDMSEYKKRLKEIELS